MCFWATADPAPTLRILPFIPVFELPDFSMHCLIYEDKDGAGEKDLVIPNEHAYVSMKLRMARYKIKTLHRWL